MARPAVRRACQDDLCCSLGLVLRRAREATGLSQERLARQAGLARERVCQWEGGTAVMGARDLLIVAAALGVPAGRLLDEAWAAAAPCTRLAVPAPSPRLLRTQGVNGARSRSEEEAAEPPRPRRAQALPAAGTDEAADLEGLARLLAEAGVPAWRAGRAADRLVWAAEDGACQARRGCPGRPALGAVRVDRAGKVFARVVCEEHARTADLDGWAVVAPPGWPA